MVMYLIFIPICIFYLIWYYYRPNSTKETFDENTYQSIRKPWNIQPRALCEELATANRYDCLHNADPQLKENTEKFEYSNSKFQSVLKEKIHPNEQLYPSAYAKHVPEKKQSKRAKDRFIKAVVEPLNNDERLSLNDNEKLEAIGTYINYYGKTAKPSIVLIDMNIVVYRKERHHGKCIRAIGYVKNKSKVKLIWADVVGIVLESDIKEFPKPKKEIPYRYGDYLPLQRTGCGFISTYDNYDASVFKESKREAIKIFQEQQRQYKGQLTERDTKFIGYPEPG